jgi:hypothetical protein
MSKVWQANLKTTIQGNIDKAWDILLTPEMWQKVDPKHYKEVSYPQPKLTVGGKGKMKTEDSPGQFSFTVTAVDNKNRQVVTQSNIPAGKLTITKRLVPDGSGFALDEGVSATGPFAPLFAKLFFNKQIKDTLPSQHAAIKAYVEK